MGQRIDLQHKLEDLLGSTNVYFQPPANVKLNYPCIVYNLEGGTTNFAENNPYKFDRRYQVTYIDRSPESPMIEKLAMMHKTTLSNTMVVDGLYHYNYNTYF